MAAGARGRLVMTLAATGGKKKKQIKTKQNSGLCGMTDLPTR
jgi:hypothetical protein